MNKHEIAYKQAKELLADILADCVMMSDLKVYSEEVMKRYKKALTDFEHHDEIKIEKYRLVWRWLDDMYEGRRYPGIEGV